MLERRLKLESSKEEEEEEEQEVEMLWAGAPSLDKLGQYCRGEITQVRHKCSHLIKGVSSNHVNM